jgi:hypothetical protein
MRLRRYRYAQLVFLSVNSPFPVLFWLAHASQELPSVNIHSGALSPLLKSLTVSGVYEGKYSHWHYRVRV